MGDETKHNFRIYIKYVIFTSLLCICNPLCRGTIRQYVGHVLRLWTVLVFPPPLEFSAHIYSEVIPTHNSHRILIYTVKNLQLGLQIAAKSYLHD